MKNRNIIKFIWILGLALVFFNGCSDEENISQSADLFRPKLISGYPMVDGNTIKLLWYQVHNASSYTIQLAQEEDFANIIQEMTTEEMSYKTPKLPYSTKFYLRLRTNGALAENNSIWKTLEASTPDREVKTILKEVTNSNILESSVKIEWIVDKQYPADSISVEKLDKVEDENNWGPYGVKLTTEQSESGEYLIENLDMATNYKVTIYNSMIEDLYERAYNSISFKTAGPPEGAKVINSEDDFKSILLNDQNDAEIKDGQIYYLRGGSFDIEGYEFKKGFHIIGAPGSENAVYVKSAFTPLQDAGKLLFSNIRLAGEDRLISNVASDGVDYNWVGLELLNSNISGFPSGFIILQTSSGNKKIIQQILIDNCIFDKMLGGKLIETDNFSDRTQVMAQIDKITISNTTFMNSPGMLMLFLPDAYGYSGSTLDLTICNVTVFEALSRAGNIRMIQMNRLTNASKVSITKCLFSNETNASSDLYMFYETCLCGSAVTSYSDNYITGTRDETGRKSVSAKKLNLSQSELFENPSEGNLKIKNRTSVIYLDQIGDSRWLK